MSQTRARMLQGAFRLLYTRLGFLHEVVGGVVYGRAWNGRRRHVVPDELTGAVLDIGCGEGWLLASISNRGVQTLGIEPSERMSRRAFHRGARAIRAVAQSLPIRDGTIQHVIATYPGPWVIDPQTWAEIARVSAYSASVQILLGGDISRGRGAFVRSRLLRLAYGKRNGSLAQLPPLGNDRVVGGYALIEDEWGQAIVWSGVRVDLSS
ncbi:MAG: class I SAM-dependent methyltransferase [Chloroflexota bacterium]|nr:class I SAM-dependent methyltransferase [Chloroflexota bacterium]